MRVSILFAAILATCLGNSALAQRQTYEGVVSLAGHNSPIVLIYSSFPKDQYNGRTPRLYSQGFVPYVCASSVYVVEGGGTIRLNVSAVRPGALGADNAIYETSGSVLSGSLSMTLVKGFPVGLWPGSIDLATGTPVTKEPW